MAKNNYNNDRIYGIVESTGDTIQIDVISNDFQLDRKFRFDKNYEIANLLSKNNLNYVLDGINKIVKDNNLSVNNIV